VWQFRNQIEPWLENLSGIGDEGLARDMARIYTDTSKMVKKGMP
jgi:hypothetical protein